MEQIWIKPVPADVQKLIAKKQEEYKKTYGKEIGKGWAVVLLIKDMKLEIEQLKSAK